MRAVLHLGTARTIALTGLLAGGAGLAVRMALEPEEGPGQGRAVRMAVDGLTTLERSNEALRREIADARSILAERNAIQLAEDESATADTRDLALIGGIWTVTASATSEWMRAAERLEQNEATTWVSERAIWSATRATRDGTRRLARVAIDEPPPLPDVSKVVSALSVLDEPRAPDRTADLAGLFVAMLVALGAALFHHQRFVKPLAGSNPSGGNADARAIGDAIRGATALVNDARSERDPKLDPAIATLTEAVGAIGRGDLAPRAMPVVPEALVPLATALDAARTGLADRLAALHGAAVAVAVDASGARSPRAIEATSELAGILTAIGESSATAEAGLESRKVAASQALAALDGVGETLRRAARELRARLGELTRRVAELAERADHLDGRAAETQAADEGLDRLAMIALVIDPLPAPNGATTPAAQVQATARRGRAALAELRRDVENLSSELMEIGDALSRVAESTAAEIPAPPPGATTAVLDTLAVHVSSTERLLDALPQLASGLTELAAAGASARDALDRLASHQPALHAALTAWDLGPRFDKTLIPALPSEPESNTLQVVRERVTDAERRLSRLLSALETTARSAVDPS